MAESRQDNGGSSEQWLTTGDMARLSHTTLRTVRFYEAEGLILAMDRAQGNHRRFAYSELLKLQAIADLREAGLSLNEIKSLIQLKGGCERPDRAVHDLTQALGGRIAELKSRIDTLTRVRRELSSTLQSIRPCGDCTNPGFPEACYGCDKLANEDLARPAHLLWKN